MIRDGRIVPKGQRAGSIRIGSRDLASIATVPIVQWRDLAAGACSAEQGVTYVTVDADGFWYVAHRGVVIQTSVVGTGRDMAARWFLAVAEAGSALTALLDVLQWVCEVWKASPAGQLAARDAAVAKAIADVPAGCDPNGWANVVKVIAAGHQERYCGPVLPEYAGTFPEQVAAACPFCVAYERARKAGYGKEAAARRVGNESATVARQLAAYEAGR